MYVCIYIYITWSSLTYRDMEQRLCSILNFITQRFSLIFSCYLKNGIDPGKFSTT